MPPDRIAFVCPRFAGEGARVLLTDLNGEGAVAAAAAIGPDAAGFARSWRQAKKIRP